MRKFDIFVQHFRNFGNSPRLKIYFFKLKINILKKKLKNRQNCAVKSRKLHTTHTHMCFFVCEWRQGWRQSSGTPTLPPLGTIILHNLEQGEEVYLGGGELWLKKVKWNSGKIALFNAWQLILASSCIGKSWQIYILSVLHVQEVLYSINM